MTPTAKILKPEERTAWRGRSSVRLTTSGIGPSDAAVGQRDGATAASAPPPSAATNPKVAQASTRTRAVERMRLVAETEAAEDDSDQKNDNQYSEQATEASAPVIVPAIAIIAAAAEENEKHNED